MPSVNKRRRSGAFKWLRALVFAGVTLQALSVLPFYPHAMSPLAALAVGGLSLVAPGLGVIAFVVLLTPALAVGDIILGLLFLLVGLSATKFLADDDGAVFVTIALAFLASRVGAAWAVAVLAGYLLGAAEGGVAALVACLALESAGTLLGASHVGVTAAGAVPHAVLANATAPADPLSFGWFLPAVKAADPQHLVTGLSGVRHVALLVAQPLLWAIAAAASGSIRRPDDDPKRPLAGLAAVAAGTGALAVSGTVAMRLFGGPVPAGDLGVAVAASTVTALVSVAIWEWMFPPERSLAAAGARGIDSDEADVDELLSLISSAEEELTSKHTVRSVVMITDMKSFSRITEEDGSVISAKLIQRHRDLLLPIIEKYRGYGKSTGGDGLVAAFGSPADALAAACEMQRTLTDYNDSRPSEREITVRIGVASGEVVLDKRGRPFIGTALNLAARVMNLGDGGQVMTTASLLEDAGRQHFRHASHGRFELKNIAHPTEVIEVLWHDGQLPKKPLIQPAMEGA